MKVTALLLVGLGIGFFIGRFSVSTVTLEDRPAPEPVAKSAIVPPAELKLSAPPTPSSAPETKQETLPAPQEAEDPTPDRESNESSPPPTYGQLDRQIAERLEQKRRRSANGLLSRSNPVAEMNPTLQGMLGKWEGDILLDDAGRTWQIRLQIEGKFENKKFQGRSFAELSRNRRVFSTSNNDGTLTNLRVVDNNKSSVWIEMGNFYLDAIYDGQTDSLYGNFYGRNDKGDYRYRGYAQLQRQ